MLSLSPSCGNHQSIAQNSNDIRWDVKFYDVGKCEFSSKKTRYSCREKGSKFLPLLNGLRRDKLFVRKTRHRRKFWEGGVCFM